MALVDFQEAVRHVRVMEVKVDSIMHSFAWDANIVVPREMRHLNISEGAWRGYIILRETYTETQRSEREGYHSSANISEYIWFLPSIRGGALMNLIMNFLDSRKSQINEF